MIKPFFKNKAFTLIELLLGLSIFAVIALCLFSTFWAGMGISERANRNTQVYGQARMALDLMSQELENMIYYDFSNSYPDKMAFSGDSRSVTFLKAASDGLKFVHYYLIAPEGKDIVATMMGATYTKNVDMLLNYEERADQENFLIREEQSFSEYVSGQEESSGSVEVLATQVKADSLRFAYGYLTGSEETQEFVWNETWGKDYLPSHIRIEIEFCSQGKKKIFVPFLKQILIPTGFWGTEDAEG